MDFYGWIKSLLKKMHWQVAALTILLNAVFFTTIFMSKEKEIETLRETISKVEGKMDLIILLLKNRR